LGRLLFDLGFGQLWSLSNAGGVAYPYISTWIFKKPIGESKVTG
jgi:hypothetical protein